ncbi:MAG TPA: hypothetical protein ENN34_12370 [Deltaproteobacteria bacterium]|nr:hypothetical protein [Deltaproteobacteria bacterium]
MKRWGFFRDGPCPPVFNMKRDTDLFEGVIAGRLNGHLRIYNWDQPAVSIGYHQKTFHPADELDIPIVKRPTGGGAVLHLNDLTFSISSAMEPPIFTSFVDTYNRIARVFARALCACGLMVQFAERSQKPSEVCFATTTPVELVFEQSKVMGCAQRIRSGFFLQQGVIPLRVDQTLSQRVFGHLLPEAPRGILSWHPEFRTELFSEHLQAAFESELNILLVDGQSEDAQCHHADEGKIDPG